MLDESDELLELLEVELGKAFCVRQIDTHVIHNTWLRPADQVTLKSLVKTAI